MADDDGIVWDEPVANVAPATPDENGIVWDQPETTADAEDKTGFFPALSSGVQGILGSGSLAYEAAYPYLSGTGMASKKTDAALDQYRAEKAAAAKAALPAGVTPFTGEGSGDFFRALKENAGVSLPYAIPGVLGAIAGGGLGAGLATYPLVAGSNLEAQIDNYGYVKDPGYAFAAAVPQAAAEAAFGMLPIAKLFRGNIGNVVSKATSTPLTKFSFGLGKEMLGEGSTEVFQQSLERWQAGLPMGDDEAKAAYLESFVAGAILGSVPGAVEGGLEARADKRAKAQRLLEDRTLLDAVNELKNSQREDLRARAAELQNQINGAQQLLLAPPPKTIGGKPFGGEDIIEVARAQPDLVRGWRQILENPDIKTADDMRKALLAAAGQKPVPNIQGQRYDIDALASENLVPPGTTDQMAAGASSPLGGLSDARIVGFAETNRDTNSPTVNAILDQPTTTNIEKARLIRDFYLENYGPDYETLAGISELPVTSPFTAPTLASPNQLSALGLMDIRARQDAEAARADEEAKQAALLAAARETQGVETRTDEGTGGAGQAAMDLATQPPRFGNVPYEGPSDARVASDIRGLEPGTDISLYAMQNRTGLLRSDVINALTALSKGPNRLVVQNKNGTFSTLPVRTEGAPSTTASSPRGAATNIEDMTGARRTDLSETSGEGVTPEPRVETPPPSGPMQRLEAFVQGLSGTVGFNLEEAHRSTATGSGKRANKSAVEERLDAIASAEGSPIVKVSKGRYRRIGVVDDVHRMIHQAPAFKPLNTTEIAQRTGLPLQTVDEIARRYARDPSASETTRGLTRQTENLLTETATPGVYERNGARGSDIFSTPLPKSEFSVAGGKGSGGPPKNARLQPVFTEDKYGLRISSYRWVKKDTPMSEDFRGLKPEQLRKKEAEYAEEVRDIKDRIAKRGEIPKLIEMLEYVQSRLDGIRSLMPAPQQPKPAATQQAPTAPQQPRPAEPQQPKPAAAQQAPAAAPQQPKPAAPQPPKPAAPQQPKPAAPQQPKAQQATSLEEDIAPTPNLGGKSRLEDLGGAGEGTQQAPPSGGAKTKQEAPQGASTASGEGGTYVPTGKERLAKSRKVVAEKLRQLRASGKVGAEVANKISQLLKNPDFDAEQIMRAFAVADALSKTFGGTDANPRVEFYKELTELHPETQEFVDINGTAMAAHNEMRGLIKISLSKDFSANMARDTAFHEGFHFLQDMINKYDPKTAEFLFGKRIGSDPNTGRGLYSGGVFRDGMTLDDIDPSIKRALQTASPEKGGKSYWDILSDNYEDPSVRADFAKQREAVAYVFGALADARNNGHQLGGLKPAFKRFLNIITQFAQNLRNVLRGYGYTNPNQILSEYAAGERQRGYGRDIKADLTRSQELGFEPERSFADDPNMERSIAAVKNNPLTQDVYHGTEMGFNIFKDQIGTTNLSLGLGIHVARDPRIASNEYFTNRSMNMGGRVLPLKTFPDSFFFEVRQDILPGRSKNTKRTPKTVRSDDASIANEMLSVAFKENPELFERIIVKSKRLFPKDASRVVNDLVEGRTTNAIGKDYDNIYDFVQAFNINLYDQKDQAEVTRLFRKHLIENGYAGVKYINTSSTEVKGSKDPICYVILPEVVSTGHFPIRSRFAKFAEKDIASPNIERSVAGGTNVSRRTFLKGLAATAATAGSIKKASAATQKQEQGLRELKLALEQPIESDGTDLQSRLFAHDLDGALKWVANNSTDSGYANIAKALLKNGLGKTRLSLLDGSYNVYGVTSLEKDGSSLIKLTTADGMNEETLLHEALHAYVQQRWMNLSKYLPSNKRLVGDATPREDAVIKEFQDIWDKVSNSIISNTDEDFRDKNIFISEFVSNPNEALSWMMTNPDLRNYLKTIDVDGKNIKVADKGEPTMFDKFIEWLCDLLGIPPTKPVRSALDDLMEAGNKVVEAGAAVKPDGSFGKAYYKYKKIAPSNKAKGTYVPEEVMSEEEENAFMKKAVSDIKESPLTNDVYHGTTSDFDEFRVDPKSRMMSLSLGVHVAKDPRVAGSEYFMDRNGGEGGRILPLKTYPDDKFFEVPQNYNDSSWAGTPKKWHNVEPDDYAVQNEILRIAYKKNPFMLARTLYDLYGRGQPLGISRLSAIRSAMNIIRDGKGTVRTRVQDYDTGNVVNQVHNFDFSVDVPAPFSDADRAKAVKIARKDMISRGFAGVKYINTSDKEVSFTGASDPTSYIIFPEVMPDKYYPLRSRFAKFDESEKSSPKIERSVAGRKTEPEFERGSIADTNTISFKRWFKNSVVRAPDTFKMIIDPKTGQRIREAIMVPLKVYHGGTFMRGRDIPMMGRKDGPDFPYDFMHFGTKASALARTSVFNEAEAEAKGMDITPAYLSIQRPKYVKDQGTTAKWAKVVEQAKAEGYDGLVYTNEYEDVGSTSYVIFDPGQAKSTDNVGTFNFADPRMERSVAGKAKSEEDAASELADRLTEIRKSGGNKQFISTGRHARMLSDFLTAKFDPKGTLDKKDLFRMLKNMATGRIKAIEVDADKTRRIIDRATKEQRDQVFKYFKTKGGVLPSNLPTELRDAALKAKADIIRVGRELVEKGILTKEQVGANEGEYLPRLYMQYIKDAKGFGTGSYRGSNRDYAMEKSDIPKDIREAMGEILEPGLPYMKAAVLPSRDMAILDFLYDVATTKGTNWVAQKSLVNWRGTKVSPFWLSEQMRDIRDNMRYEQDPARLATMNKVANEMQDIVDKTDMHGDVGKDYKRLPNTARYGALRGMAVRKEIYEDIVGMGSYTGDLDFFSKLFSNQGAVTKAVNFWKLTKTVYNPTTHARQFFSNMITANLSGINLHNIPVRMIEAIDDMRNEKGAWKIAVDNGVTATGMVDQELKDALNDLKKIANASTGGVFSVIDLNKWSDHWVSKLSPANVYQLSDYLFKTMKIIDEMKRYDKEFGPAKDAKEKKLREGAAVIEANEWFMDYGDVSAFIKSFRSHALGMPFVTYQYKIAPKIIETVLLRPWRLAPYVGLYYAMPALAAAMMDLEDDDLERLKKATKEYLRNNPSALPLPWKDDRGNFQFIDVGYLFPWSYMTGLINATYNTATGNASGSEIAKSVGLFGSPVISSIVALSNVDTFTGQQIINKYDTPQDKVKDFLGYVWGQIAPPIITNYGAIGGPVADLISGNRGDIDRKGNPKRSAAQLVAQAFGFNVYPVNPAQQFAQNVALMDNDLKRAQANLTYELNNMTLSPESRREKADRGRADLIERRRKIQKYIEEARPTERLLRK